MAHAIGRNVRQYREKLAWTQEALATAAQISSRTVQRIEDGGPASPESLRSIADAFNVSLDDLRRGSEETEQSRSAADEALKTVGERYEIVHLVHIKRASQLSPLLTVADAFLFSRVALQDDEEEDAVAEVEGHLRDALDMWGEISPQMRRDFERELQGLMERLLAKDLIVTAGTHSRRLRSMDGKNESFPMTTLYVVVSRKSEPKLYLALDKKAPVQFV